MSNMVNYLSCHQEMWIKVPRGQTPLFLNYIEQQNKFFSPLKKNIKFY